MAPMTEVAQSELDRMEERKVTESALNEQPKNEHQVIAGIKQDECDEIVSDGQSCATSHDHAYDHQIDHLPSAPLNESASLICSFAECVDLTFNHPLSLLRHTRLKHSQSLRQIHCKPFTNVRRPTQSNHVLKSVLISRFKCSLCDEWFQWRDDLEIHVIQEHTIMEVVTGGFGEWTRTLESDEELEGHRGVHQQKQLYQQLEHQVTQLNKLSNQSSFDCPHNQLLTDIQQQTLQQPQLNKSSNQSSLDCPHNQMLLHNQQRRYQQLQHQQINLDQFNANPGQFNPNLTQSTSSIQTKSNSLPSQPVSSSLDQSSHSLNQFNAKPKFILKSANISTISRTSPSQSNIECRINDAMEKVDNEMKAIESSMEWSWNEVEKCWELLKNGQIDRNEEDSVVDQLNGLEHESNIEDAEAQGAHIPSNMNTSLTPPQCRASVEWLNDQNIEHTNQTVQTNSIESVPSPSHRHNTIPVFASKSYPKEHQVTQLNKSTNQSSLVYPHNQLLRDSQQPTLQQLQHPQINLDQFNANPVQFNTNQTKSNPLSSQLVSSSLDQLSVNMDQSSPSSIQSITQSNSTLKHPNLTLKPPITLSKPISETNKRNSRAKKFRTMKDITQHYSSSVSQEFNLPCDQCIKFKNRKDSLEYLRTYHNINLDQPNLHEFNPLPSQPAFASLDQFSANLDQSSHNQFNVNSKFIMKPTNLNIISSTSTTQSNLEVLDYDDQHSGNVEELSVGAQINDENCEAEDGSLKNRENIEHEAAQAQLVSNKKQSGKHVCEHCAKGFQSPIGLRRHIRTHTNDRPFKCPECVQTFTQNGNMQRHLTTHTGIKTHFCEKCGKGFRDTSELNRHIRTHIGYQPFKCPKCAQAFNNKTNMKRHLVSQHDNLPEHICEHCGKTFKQSNILKAHTRTHTGDKPFVCTWNNCGKAFRTKQQLKIHEFTHTGEKPYKLWWLQTAT